VPADADLRSKLDPAPDRHGCGPKHPAWNGGYYSMRPPSLRTAAEMLFFVGSNPVLR
jgi:hypothetical protein